MIPYIVRARTDAGVGVSMTKSNWLIIGILIVASIVFAGMWYAFGFNLVDPSDLLISVVWWVVILAVCLGIKFSEAKRRRSVRTSFIAPGLIYNPEAGIVRLGIEQPYVSALQSILSNLDYGYSSEVIANDQRIRFDYIVRSDKFSNNGETWVGEVVKASNPDDVRTFQNKRELAHLIDAA